MGEDCEGVNDIQPGGEAVEFYRAVHGLPNGHGHQFLREIFSQMRVALAPTCSSLLFLDPGGVSYADEKCRGTRRGDLSFCLGKSVPHLGSFHVK